MIFVLIFGAVAMAQAGDWCLRHAQTPNAFFWLGLALYAASAWPVWASYRRGSWFEVALLWTVTAVVMSAFTGSIVIGEKLAFQQWLAFILAAASGVCWCCKSGS
jgi:hypothetical protein